MPNKIKNGKPNLVIIHSFPTNSTILAGLYDYLADFFIVYPIDLPGFTSGIKPLEVVNLESYANYLKREITRLEIQDYWVGGVSFGFLVANMMGTHKHCRGVLAIEPYLGSENLKIPLFRKLFYVLSIKIIEVGNAFYRVWHNPFIQKYLLMGSSARFDKKIKKILDVMDARTFFETAKILLTSHETDCKLHEIPYILVINKGDGSIRADRIISRFALDVDDLLIAHTTAEHYPETITKEYFEKRIDKKEVDKILEFVQKYNSDE